MCEDCTREYPRYSPACLNCGRRYLAAIQARPMPKPEKVTWLRKVLADWKSHGHAEDALRAPVDRKRK